MSGSNDDSSPLSSPPPSLRSEVKITPPGSITHSQPRIPGEEGLTTSITTKSEQSSISAEQPTPDPEQILQGSNDISTRGEECTDTRIMTDKNARTTASESQSGNMAASKSENTRKRKGLQTPKEPPKRSKLPNITPRKLKRWQPDYVIQNERSPLATADIRSVLLHPLAWDALSPEDRAEVLAAFPDSQHILHAGTPEARPNVVTLRSDDSFRYGTARFAEHIADGRHDPEWLHQAWLAHERNQAGDFQEFEVATFEEDWEVKLPDNMRPEPKGRDQAGGESVSAAAKTD